MKKISIAASVAIALALISGVAFAAPTSTAQAKPKKPGLLSKLIHHGKTAKGKASASAPKAGTGQIIGDKKTKVYHLPSDKYTLPAEQNRVYFKTAAQAQAAGYRHAGGKSTATGTKSKKSKSTAASKGSKKMGAKSKSTGKKATSAKKKSASSKAKP